MAAALFADVAWGGAQALEQSLQRSQALDLNTAVLAALYDIDRPEDLRRWREL